MGKNLKTISPLGIGTSQLASWGRGITLVEAKRLFDTALDYNATTIDTADTYGSGDSERIVGKAIANKRADFYIITKAGFPHLDLPGLLSPFNQIGKKIMQKAAFKQCYSKKYLINSLEKSLKRLNTDYVDAFLLHEPLGAALKEFDDFYEALELIKKKGMANHVGISTNDAAAYHIASGKITLDLVETGMPYIPDEKETVFGHAKKDCIPVVLNEVLKPYKSLLANDSIMAVLKKHAKSDEDLLSILLAYAINEKKGQCALIGTRNPKHLIQNIEGFHNNAHFIAIFNEISSQFSVKVRN